jgi:hypothetical protein
MSTTIKKLVLDHNNLGDNGPRALAFLELTLLCRNHGAECQFHFTSNT